MRKSKFSDAALLAAAQHPSGRWMWMAAVGTLAVVAFLCTQFPVDAAALLGRPSLDGTNASYFRAAILGFGVLITLRARALPWYHTLIALLICVGHGGQVLRAVFSPASTPMPLSLVFLNAAIITYLLVLGIRPSVYELLAEERALREDVEEELEAITRDRDFWRQRAGDLEMLPGSHHVTGAVHPVRSP